MPMDILGSVGQAYANRLLRCNTYSFQPENPNFWVRLYHYSLTAVKIIEAWQVVIYLLVSTAESEYIHRSHIRKGSLSLRSLVL